MDTFWWIVIGVAIVLYIGWLTSVELNKEKEKEKAKNAYRQSLAQLTHEPTKAELRQKTLQLGRTYSNLTRDSKGVTIFDEIALMNDINAACAGATTAINKAPASSVKVATLVKVASLEDRLIRLSKLKDQGLVDDVEYKAKRQQLLDEV